MPIVIELFLYGIIIPQHKLRIPAKREPRYTGRDNERKEPMLIPFRTFRDPWEAHLFRTRLEAEGIPAFVFFDQHISNNWPLSVALGGVQVRIPAEMTDEAEAVVERCVEGKYLAELEDVFGPLERTCCPQCGSTDIRRRPSLQQIGFGLGLTLCFSAPMRMELTRLSCKKCGATWQEQADKRH